jgi:hypothetical protein
MRGVVVGREVDGWEEEEREGVRGGMGFLLFRSL